MSVVEELYGQPLSEDMAKLLQDGNLPVHYRHGTPSAGRRSPRRTNVERGAHCRTCDLAESGLTTRRVAAGRLE